MPAGSLHRSPTENVIYMSPRYVVRSCRNEVAIEPRICTSTVLEGSYGSGLEVSCPFIDVNLLHGASVIIRRRCYQKVITYFV